MNSINTASRWRALVSAKVLSAALVSAAAAVTLSTSALADDIRLGVPGYGGTGCPAGSVSATLSPDQKALTLIFDQYVVEAGGFSGKRLDRKNCQIALPIHVPSGYSFSILEMDYRGFNSLPRGASSQLNLEYFLAYPGSPSSGLRYSKRFMGPQDQEYLVSNVLGLEAVVWSPCGTDVNLRTTTSMMVQANSRNESSMATVDSIDAKAGIVYALQWRRCN